MGGMMAGSQVRGRRRAHWRLWGGKVGGVGFPSHALHAHTVHTHAFVTLLRHRLPSSSAHDIRHYHVYSDAEKYRLYAEEHGIF